MSMNKKENNKTVRSRAVYISFAGSAGTGRSYSSHGSLVFHCGQGKSKDHESGYRDRCRSENGS